MTSAKQYLAPVLMGKATTGLARERMLVLGEEQGYFTFRGSDVTFREDPQGKDWPCSDGAGRRGLAAGSRRPGAGWRSELTRRADAPSSNPR